MSDKKKKTIKRQGPSLSQGLKNMEDKEIESKINERIDR